MVSFRLAAIVAAVTFLSVGAAGRENQVARAPMTPVALAAAIEQRAEHTSFADLQRFGEAAARGSGRENLNRLQHVATVMLNQSEFDSFEHWNAILVKKAHRARRRAYQTIARINALKSLYDRGDGSTQAQVERIAPHRTGLVRASLRHEPGGGDAPRTRRPVRRWRSSPTPRDWCPRATPMPGAARAYIWELVGLALMDLYDLQGSAAAFDRADFQDTDRTLSSAGLRRRL